MSLQVTAPVRNDVSALEQAQGGNKSADKEAQKISKSKKALLDQFIGKHIEPSKPSNNAPITTAINQISQQEQAAAVSLRGVSEQKRNKSKSEYQELYETLFVADEFILKVDVESFVKSLIEQYSSDPNRQKALVDLNTSMGERDRNLRKYLLAQIALQELPKTDPARPDLEQFIARLSLEDLNYIRDSMLARRTGQSIGMQGVSLREFVVTYQKIDLYVESRDKESKTTEILDLYRMIRNRVKNANFKEEIGKSLWGFYSVITREKSQHPSKITEMRQFGILARVKQLCTLSQLVGLHQDFFKFCNKAGVKGLPDISNLIENCLQYIASGEAFAGVNMLAQVGSNVHGPKPGIKSMVMNNYRRKVLLNPIMIDLYKSPELHSKLTDALDKAEKSANIHQLGKMI